MQPMHLFERLKGAAGASDEWHAYVAHPFVAGLIDGTLPKPCFQRYLVQDYLFLIHFARAFALAAYKSDTLADLADRAGTLSRIAPATRWRCTWSIAAGGHFPRADRGHARRRRRWPIPAMCWSAAWPATCWTWRSRWPPAPSATAPSAALPARTRG